MTAHNDLPSAKLALAEKLQAPDGSWPLRQKCAINWCDGEYHYPGTKNEELCPTHGWIPTDMHLEDVISAAAKAGIKTIIPWPWGDRDPGPGDVVEATRGGFGKTVTVPFTSDQHSIMLAAINAVLKVLP